MATYLVSFLPTKVGAPAQGKFLSQGLPIRHQNRVVDPRRRIRILLIGFVIGLVLSGVTAFPLPQEVNMLANWMGAKPGVTSTGMLAWIVQVQDGLQATDAKYPFLFYGTDWLAFGHLVIAAAFYGPIKDPVKNVWVIQWGMIACVGVIPLALICGSIRGIPFEWRLIDCSFGIVGIVPLWVCLRDVRRIEQSG
jgi:hypothetical protein